MGIFFGDNYKIIEKIGEGGFGDVYLIEKEKEIYALKKSKVKLDKDKMNQLNKIIDIVKKINNVHIIRYYSSFLENEHFCVLMEYAGNKNLKHFIENYKKKNELIEERIIKFIIIQICKGLIDIHKNKLIHRDLTPDNIFINKNNGIKIGDFGISKILSTNTKYAKNIIGKYHYFAPEMELGQKYNNKVDIYSLGCIIYELFTLNEYYLDKKINENVCKINTDIYNSKWQEIIDLLIKKDYHERPDIEKIYELVRTIKTIEYDNLIQYSFSDINQLSKLFEDSELLSFDDDCLIKDDYYNEIKDSIKCPLCNTIKKEIKICLECKSKFCEKCSEKKHACKSSNFKEDLSHTSLLGKLKFTCKKCKGEIIYKDIENHIIFEYNKNNKLKFIDSRNSLNFNKNLKNFKSKIILLIIFIIPLIVILCSNGGVGKTSLIKR